MCLGTLSENKGRKFSTIERTSSPVDSLKAVSFGQNLCLMYPYVIVEVCVYGSLSILLSSEGTL